MAEIPKNPDDFNAYLTADCTHELRIKSSEKDMCTLTVHQDPRTMIMIQAKMSENKFSDLENPYPKTFRGNLAIRIAAILEDVEHMPGREIMSNAFFSLNLEDAIVEVSIESDK